MRAVQVKIKDRKIIAERKQQIDKRLEKKPGMEVGYERMLKGGNIHYEMSDKIRAIGSGGIGAIHTMVQRLGLPAEIDKSLKLLKVHAPYFESDHVLNIAYNVLCGGECLEDIERLRNDETYMDALGARRIPDPTTAGDFLRRFSEEDLLTLMEVINEVRLLVWDEAARSDSHFFDEAIVEVDGTIAPTLGECKQGMDMSYKGVWGYAPLIVTLANTREVLYVVNRSGNTPSSKDSGPWIERAIELVLRRFKKVVVRGDTDFSSTKYLDKWSKRGVKFVFGYDAHQNLVEKAESLPEALWMPLKRNPKYNVATCERIRPTNVKEEIVRERGYTNMHLLCEDVAEFDYQPSACKHSYRIVVIRKNISVEKGEETFLPQIRYFFYITNLPERSQEDIVFAANQRCDQENIIAQLKSGINALRMPTGDLNSNWAYMIIASMAWTMKSWFAMMINDKQQRRAVIRMEYKKFLLNFISLPCQIVRSGRRLIYRILNYNTYLETFFETFDAIKRLRYD